MKKHYFVSLLVILSIVVIFFSCGKDDTPVPVGNPVITPTFAIIASDGKSSDVSVKISWTSVNTVRAFINGSPISVPSGDTIIFATKGDTKNFTFVAENIKGIKTEEYLTVNIPADSVLPPTITLTVDHNSVNQGEVVVINYTTTNADKVYYEGVAYPPSDQLVFTVDQTTTYCFKAVGEGGEVEDSVMVVVTPVSPDPIIDTWKQILLQSSYTIDGERKKLQIWQCELDDRIIFESNHTGYYDFGTNLCTSLTTFPFAWLMVGDTLTGFGNRKVEYSTDLETMVWSHWSVEIQQDGITTLPVVIWETFIRE